MNYPTEEKIAHVHVIIKLCIKIFANFFKKQINKQLNKKIKKWCTTDDLFSQKLFPK